MEKESKKEKMIDYRPFLNKILVCGIVIIILLVLNTVALFLSLKDESTTNNTDNGGDETLNYDVSMFETVDETTLLSRVTDENNSDIQVVYIGRSNCGFCVKFLPYLQQAQNEFEYKTLYLDITTLSSDGYDKIAALEEKFFTDLGSTPMIVLFQNGKFVAGQVGYMEYSELKSFLESHGLTAK